MPRARHVCALALVFLASSSSLPGIARADAVVETTIERADRLFNEARKLEEKGDAASIDEACKRFAESQRLDPKLGRLLNLAVCHEKQGKTATAYEEFREGASWASQKGQKERAEFAQKEAAALEKKLSFVDLVMPSGVGEDDVTSVAIDGVELARERWMNPFPADPGKHSATLKAKGKKDVSFDFEVKDPGVESVHVPAFAEAPKTATNGATSDASTSTATGGSSTRTIGWIVAGTGVVALGVGAYFGFHAASQKSDADPHCPDKACDPTGSSLIHDARTSATISTIALGVGVVAVGIGGYLVFKPAKGVTTGVAPSISPQFAGIHVETTF